MWTASTSDMPTTFDFDALKRALAAIPEDPLEVWMRAQGFDPAHGGVLYLPLTMRAEFLGPPPAYVHFSSVIGRPMLAHDITRLPWHPWV